MEDTALIKPRATHKLPDCDRCLLYSYNPFLLCAVHPTGPKGDICLDFRADSHAENRQFEGFLGLESRTGHEMEDSETPFENSFDLDPDEEQWEPEKGRFVKWGASHRARSITERVPLVAAGVAWVLLGFCIFGYATIAHHLAYWPWLSRLLR